MATRYGTGGSLLKSATAMVAALLVLTGARAEETPLSESCIFTAAAQLPTVPGLVIRSSFTTPSSMIPIGGADPTLRQWKVTLTIEAAGQVATYEALCSAGNNTAPNVTRMAIRDVSTSLGPAPLPAGQSKKE